MELERLAVVFVFVGNAAAIGLLAFMLFRILSQTKQTHEMLQGSAQDLMTAGKRLREALQTVDRLSERLIDVNKSADAAQLPHSAAESQQALVAMPANDQLGAELQLAQAKLAEANAVIQQLRRAHRQAEATTQSAEAQRVSMEQQQQSLNLAKQRAIKAELVSINLKQELDKISAEADKRSRDTTSDMDNMRAQMQAINEERSALFRQLEDLKEVMKRTIVEKDFIEDKLLHLDEAHYTTEAAQSDITRAAEPVR